MLSIFDDKLFWPISISGLTILLAFLLVSYILLFFTYLLMRWWALRRDRRAYADYAGQPYSARWSDD